MARLVSIPKSEVEGLGSAERIGAHYGDELNLNELLTLAERVCTLAERWGQASPPEREKLLREREAVLAQGDQLATRSPATVSPLLRDELTRAREDWQRARGVLLQER